LDSSGERITAEHLYSGRQQAVGRHNL
jgi:hypothetical protein